MASPYTAEMRSASSPQNVPPLEQQDFVEMREETANTEDESVNDHDHGRDDERTPADWVNDQEQFSHLPPLPEGWIRVRSRTTGDIYYCYADTGETTLTEPTVAGPLSEQENSPTKGDAQDVELPPGWVEVVSRSSGKIYYWHAGLQKSQFTRPTAADATGGSEGDKDDKLPPGWIKMLSKSTGKQYYFNTETQVSQFEFPT